MTFKQSLTPILVFLAIHFYVASFVVAQSGNVLCPPNGSIYSSSTHKCYTALITTSDWYAAEEQCRAIGVNGHLTSIDIASENRYIVELLKNEFCTDPGQVWIGANNENDGTFSWTNEKPFNYTNWGTNNPQADPNLNCAYIGTTDPYTGLWYNNVNCYTYHKALCASDPTPNVCELDSH